MAKVAATPRTRAQRVRSWRPRIGVEERRLAVAAVFAPIAFLAPDGPIRWLACLALLTVTYLVGYFDGRRDLAADLILRDRRDDRGPEPTPPRGE